MNQNDQPDNDQEVKENTFNPFETKEISKVDLNQISASSQIVEDISASPDEIFEFPLPKENKEEILETVPTSEISPIVEAPISSMSEPSETGSYQLANAMVDRPYQANIDLRELKVENAKLNLDFANQVKRLGLSVQRVENVIQIEGIPSADTQGEHILCLDYTYDDIRIHRKKITLLINPDPKSLWKNLEPDENLLYRKDHLTKKVILSKDFKIVAASRRGRSHAHEGKFREDDFAIQANENGWHILIVSDGAGSAKLSRRGSYLACQAAMEFVEKSIDKLLEPTFETLIDEFAGAKTEKTEKEIKNLLYQVLCGGAFNAYKRLEQESTSTGNPLRDYSATFLLAIAKKYTHGFFIAAFGIGDGAIGVYTRSPSKIDLMNSPDGGEFSGQTRFLTMRDVIGNGDEMLRRLKFKLFEKFNLLALMTDGISDPKFGTDNNLLSSEKWKEFVEELGEINLSKSNDNSGEQLLEYMDFWYPGEHDDRTLAILY